MARLFLFQDIKKDAATNMMLHRKHLETVEDNIHAHTHIYIYISMSISVSFFVSMYDYIYIYIRTGKTPPVSSNMTME